MESIISIKPNSSEAYVAACAVVMVCDDQVDERELTETIKAAMKSSHMIKLVESLGKNNHSIEHLTASLSAGDYSETLERLSTENANDEKLSDVDDDYRKLLDNFDPKKSLAVIANVKAAWAAARENDTEFELLDVIANKIDSNLSQWVLSSCIDVAKADGALQNEEEYVLAHLATKWGQEEYLCKILQALTGRRWSMLEVAGRKMLLPSDDKTEVIEEKTELSPLWKAITEMDTEKAIDLVEAGASVNDLYDYNDEIRNLTPLMIAAEQMDMGLVQALINAGADINAKASGGYVPLTWALKGENIDNIRLLLSAGADVNPLEEGEGGFSPLSMAAKHGLDDAAKQLIDVGANINWTNDDGQTVLKAAVMDQQASVVQILLSAGADPNIVDHEGYAAIHNAASNGDIEIIQLLLSSGVDVNMPLVSPAEDEGENALNAACFAGNIDLVKFLENKGAKQAGNPLRDVLVGAYQRSADPAELIEYLLREESDLIEVDAECLIAAAITGPISTFKAIHELFMPVEDLSPEFREFIRNSFKEYLPNVPDDDRREETSKIIEVAGW